MQQRRMPAEWEATDAILMAWPDATTDWEHVLEGAQECVARIVHAVAQFAQVVLLTAEPLKTDEVLREIGCDMGQVHLVEQEVGDTWCRDYGPITIEERAGYHVLLDCGFNGWGLKFSSAVDNVATRQLAAKGVFGQTPLRTIPLILEGGSIESDGEGTILSTAQCLYEANRNPHLHASQLQTALKDLLGAQRLIVLEHGHLQGDDTDAHIDTLARLCPNQTICYVQCDDPNDDHFPALEMMETELKQLKTIKGSSYRLVPLPWPAPIYADDGHRLPATYANYLVVNGLVLIPTYDDPADDKALKALSMAYPDHHIFGVNCRVLLEQHGSLHCMTMQLPQGTLSPRLGEFHPKEGA